MEYANITTEDNKIIIIFNSVEINEKNKLNNLVKKYKEEISIHNNIHLIVDCTNLISVDKKLALLCVRNLRKFEDKNRDRFVEKTIVITKPGIRFLANIIMKFYPPVVKTNIVKKLNQ